MRANFLGLWSDHPAAKTCGLWVPELSSACLDVQGTDWLFSSFFCLSRLLFIPIAVLVIGVDYIALKSVSFVSYHQFFFFKMEDKKNRVRGSDQVQTRQSNSISVLMPWSISQMTPGKPPRLQSWPSGEGPQFPRMQ